MILALLLCGTAMGRGVDARRMVDRLSRRGASGRIAVSAGAKQLPGDAEVTFKRAHADDAMRKIREGWGRRHRKGAGTGAASPRRARLMGSSAPESSPKVLASYDIAIKSGGSKWQPDADDPVRVTVELDDPVTVGSTSTLGVVHLADDGTVEELESSRYGFVYDATRTLVTAFWFDAFGFSVYAITETETPKTGSDPARRLYDFYSLDFNTNSVTWNQYVRRYFTTIEGNTTFRQIVKDGEMLVRPEVLPSPLGRTFMGWHLYDPAKAGQTVDGVTYDAEGYATTKFDFTQPIVFNPGETGENEYQLRAVFDRVGYVIFHEQPSDGDWPITAVRRGVMREVATNIVVEAGVEKTNITMQASVPISDVTVTYDDTAERQPGEEPANTTPRMIFRGWSTEKVMPGATTNVLGGPIELLGTNYVFTRTKNTEAVPRDLYPVFVNINWLAFSSGETGQGATYIPPHFFYADEGTNRFPVPSRTGYTFEGWYTSTNAPRVKVVDASSNLVSSVTTDDISEWGGVISNGMLRLTKDTTLYANWEPAPTKYTVVVWQQKSTDAADLPEAQRTYDFVDSYTNIAKSASEVSVADTYKNWAGQASNTVHAASYAGFHFGHCDGKTTVNGNGSTVLNVYYDRDVHTLRFRLSSNGSYIRTITELYGASIKDYFPIVGTDGTTYEGTTWTPSTYFSQRLATIENMPPVDIIFTRSTNTGTGGTIYYYVEVDQEDSDGEQFGGKYYKLYKTVTHDFNFLTYAEEFHDIAGYITDRTHADPQFGVNVTSGYGWNQTTTYDENRANLDPNGNKLYYDRASYTINFTDSYNSDPKGEASVKYSQKITADMIPSNPESSRPGYSFNGWYVDSACSTRVFFDEAQYNASTLTNKVLYARMPANNLNFYAGWSTVWFLIEIDPNGGELMFVGENSSANQSTWFWEPYNGDPIEEYTTVSRSFEESALYGTFFYAKQSRDYYGSSRGWTQEWTSEEDTIKSRRAYYTTNQSDPARVDDRRYRQAQNVYRYAGWYEVKTDEQGNETEELYAFGQPVQKNTKLKLHWKHLGTYRLHYDVGTTGGQLSNGDENETVLETLDASVYADSSEILVTRTAIPPDGYAFAGWRIRYGDDTVYHPGQTFLFNSAYTRDVPGENGKTIHQLVLDAVYTQVRTVALTMDANGGTLDGTVATTLPLAYPDAPSLITNVNDSATQRTVSGMRNNAYGHLSDGNGYSCVVDGVSLPFLGWNTSADGTGTHFDGGQYVGVDTLGTPDENGRNILYAEWGVLVYFDKNNKDADWNAAAWPTNCVWDEAKGLFCQTNKLNGCATDPAVPLTSSNSEEMFRYWGIKRYSGEIEPYDFSTPLTNASITLYGVWSNRIEVAVHAVDVTDGARTNKDADWLQEPAAIVMDASTYKSFETDSAGYAIPGESYAFAFACLCDGKSGHADVSDEMAITNVYYNVAAQHVYVTYADGRSEAMPDGKEIYFVYFQSSNTVPIGYKVMALSGSLTSATVRSGSPQSVNIGVDDCNIATEIPRPQYYASNVHSNYAYAVGVPNAGSGLQLQLITTASKTDTDRPSLLVKNSWTGYQCSLDGGLTWIEYGYDAQLYVIYFDAQPTVISLTEKTVGTLQDMSESFEYEIVVSEFTVTTVEMRTETQTRSSRNGSWSSSSYSDPMVTSITTNAPTSKPSADVVLADGEAHAVTLMYSPTVSEWDQANWNSSTYTRTRGNTRTITETIQRVTITQTAKNGFTTENDGVGGDKKYIYQYTTANSSAGSDSDSVTFTNTRIADTIPVHVALGQDGSVSNRDDLRTSDASVYTMTVTNGTDNAVTIDGAPAGFFTGDATRYSFMGIFYARTNENGVVTAISTDPVKSVTFAPMGADGYFGLYFDGDPENAVGDWDLYAVYAEMPKIYYVKEGANGALSLIDPITYEGAAVTNMGFGATTITQGLYAAPDATNAFSVSTSPGIGKYFVPIFLDSLHEGSRMTQSSLAAGPDGATNMSAMDGVTESNAMHLKVVGGILKWSTDGETWRDFTGTPAVYVAYTDPGFNLTVVKESLASDADKTADTFTFTISSSNLVDGVTYAVSGYSTEEIAPVNGVITLIMTNGSRVTIHALPDDPRIDINRQYEIREQTTANYTLTNALINGYAPALKVENGVGTILSENKTVEFTNIKSYTVTFVDEDGTEISTATYPYGTTPDEFKSGVDDPTKPMDATSIYRFDEWGPTLETVGSNTTYTAEYKKIKIPHATQRSETTNIVVKLEDEQKIIDTLKSQGIDILSDDYSADDANEQLNNVDPNGLRRWENLVTGSDTNQLVLSTATGTEDSTTVQLTAGSDESKYADLGYIVLRDLRKLEDGKWNRKDGPKAGDNPEFNIPLLDSEGKSVDATGLYRVTTLIIPKYDLSITNEIPSTNIIGVLEIASTMTNTLAAVPWHTLASDPANPTNITVAAWAQKDQLAGTSYVRALGADGGYEMWQFAENAWTSFTTSRTAENGGSSTVEAEAATARRLERGEPVWLTRSDVSKPFFLVGQYAPEAVTEPIAGGDGETLTPSMLTNPTFLPMEINKLEWGGTPDKGDQIHIPTEGATPTILTWNGSNWGSVKTVVTRTASGRYKAEGIRVTDHAIPPGRGFWYYRKAQGGLSVTFPAIPCN